jgi:hypothetical protein
MPGWTWGRRETQWEDGFRSLCAFVEREGHACVPQSHIEGDFKLGRWVNKRRISYARNTLSSERVARLEALPRWTWSVRTGSRAQQTLHSAT